jgi:hypothetical protein
MTMRRACHRLNSWLMACTANSAAAPEHSSVKYSW